MSEEIYHTHFCFTIKLNPKNGTGSKWKLVPSDSVMDILNYCRICDKNFEGVGIHLFVKVPRPGDSEGLFSVFK